MMFFENFSSQRLKFENDVFAKKRDFGVPGKYQGGNQKNVLD